MNIITLFLLITLYVTYIPLLAEPLTAVASNGKAVLLHEDGTWTYAPAEEVGSQEETHFRKARWGMSEQAIIAQEGEPIHRDENFIGYEGKLINKDVIYAYIFVNDQLFRGKYVVQEKHSNKNDYLLDYEALQKVLTKKYSDPNDSKDIWRNDLYQDDYSHWGFAVGLGHYLRYTTWETPDTEIFLGINGENNQISVAIEYKSRKLKDLEEQIREQEVEDDL